MTRATSFDDQLSRFPDEYPILALIGPTSIGKTDLSLEIARRTGAHIVSVDAFQCYRYFDIGTAKVSAEIRRHIPHHLIDILNPDQAYDLQQFLSRSSALVSQLREQKTPIIFCGGTGLHMRAFLYRYQLSEMGSDPVLKAGSDPISLREQLSRRLETEGLAVLVEELRSCDPASAMHTDLQNPRRVLRALERFKAGAPSLPTASAMRSDTMVLGLSAERSVIHSRINQRVLAMIQSGFVEEVDAILKLGYAADAAAFSAIGYREIAQYLSGSERLEKVVDLIQAKTRQFAKRQLTWYRRFENVTWKIIQSD